MESGTKTSKIPPKPQSLIKSTKHHKGTKLKHVKTLNSLQTKIVNLIAKLSASLI